VNSLKIGRRSFLLGTGLGWQLLARPAVVARAEVASRHLFWPSWSFSSQWADPSHQVKGKLLLLVRTAHQRARVQSYCTHRSAWWRSTPATKRSVPLSRLAVRLDGMSCTGPRRGARTLPRSSGGRPGHRDL